MAADPQSRRPRVVLYGLVAGLAVLTSLFLTRNIDFRVYWYGAGALFDGSRPLYGPHSGLGFPMQYRYPPVTYILLAPLRRMPLFWAGALWMMGAWAAVAGTVVVTVRIAHLRFSPHAAIAACACMLAYVVLAIRYGNVQPYLIAMILAALMLSETYPVASAALLALAISFKIWPIFFAPWFLRKGRRMVLVWLIPAMLLLWLVPLTLWSPSRYLDLTGQWVRSEFQNAANHSEIWYFPGQSLRGILLRYLTPPGPWSAGFPNVQMLSFSPDAVVRAWEAIAAVTYVAACIAMLRSDPARRWIWDGISFALFTILQPFCLKSGMISLGPAVLIAAALYSRTRERAARGLFLGACALSFFAAVMQYKPVLRLLLVVGLDFYAALLLLVALAVWAGNPESDRCRWGE